MRWSVWKSTFHCAFVLNHRVCTPSTRRLLDGAAVRVPHWLICAQALADADVLRPPVPAKKYDEEAYNTSIEVLTRGHEARAPIGKYSRGDKFGVYAVLVDVQDGPHAGSYHGAASLGVRPMFGVNTANLETFIFDFSGDLYGATLSVGLVEFLRPEIKFDTLQELITQMDADCLQARSILSK